MRPRGRCISKAWLPLFVRRINADVGSRTVIRIRAQGTEAPSWRFGVSLCVRVVWRPMEPGRKYPS
jgi:hypothetical protein